MADEIGSAAFRIDADLTSFSTGLADAERMADGSVNAIGRSFGQMGERIEEATGPIRKFTGAISSTVGIVTGLIGSVTFVIGSFAAYGRAITNVMEQNKRTDASALSLKERIDELGESTRNLTEFERQRADAIERIAAVERELNELRRTDRGLRATEGLGFALSAAQREILGDIDRRSQQARDALRRANEDELGAQRQAIFDSISSQLDTFERAASSPTEQVRATFDELAEATERLRAGFGDDVVNSLLARLEAARTYELETIRLADEQRRELDRQAADRQREAAERNAKAYADALGREVERALGSALQFNLDGLATTMEQLRAQIELIGQSVGRI